MFNSHSHIENNLYNYENNEKESTIQVLINVLFRPNWIPKSIKTQLIEHFNRKD